MKVFLDDVRDPPDESWVLCRSVIEFQNVVNERGFPDVVSFDHDLGDNVPSGKDAANWLVELDLDKGLMKRDFEFIVHSANPPGRANIQSLMTSYLRFKFSP